MERALRTILKTSYILITLLLLYGLSFYMVLAVQLPAEQSVLSYIADQYLAPSKEPTQFNQVTSQATAETTSDEPIVTEDNTEDAIPTIPPINYHHVDNGNDDEEDDSDDDDSNDNTQDDTNDDSNDNVDDATDNTDDTQDTTNNDSTDDDTSDDDASDDATDDTDDTSNDDTTPPTAFPTFPKLVVTPNPSNSATASITAVVDSTPADKVEFDENNIVITLPTGTTGTLIITIDNTQYTVELTSDDVQIETELN